MKLPETNDRGPSQREAWSLIRALLPPDPELERLAREKGALLRKRGVKAAAALLRILLSYACSTLSQRDVCEWAQDSDWAQLTRNALRQRLHRAAPWLKYLLEWVIGQRTVSSTVAGFRVVLVDATRIAPPGSKGKAWCAHTLLDPWLARTVQLELTDHKGGEHLRRFRFSSGDLVIGDSGYAHRRSLAHVVENQAKFLVRTNWCNLPFETLHGRDFDLFESANHLSECQSAEFDIRIKPDKDHGIPAIPGRLIVYRKSDEDAEAARKKVLAEAKRKHRQVDERTLLACQYILLVTNVEPQRLTVSQLLDLYRIRWQIELGYKRWKTLLNLDDLVVRQADSVRATLTAKLLGVVLVEGIVASQTAGEAVWKYTRRVGEAFRQAVLGEGAVAAVLGKQTAARPVGRERHRTRQREQLLMPGPQIPEISVPALITA